MYLSSIMSTSSSSLPVDPHSVNYFHGRISRQDAERLLSEDGRDGLFLLRWCISHVNGYAVSVIYHHRSTLDYTDNVH